jgi:hypothetical protein
VSLKVSPQKEEDSSAKTNDNGVTRWYCSELMARRKEINPDGSTRKLSVVVSEPVAEALHKEAAKAGKSVGAIMREKLEKAS